MTRFFAIAALCLLAACAGKNDLDEPPTPLGNFELGHNIVVAPHPAKGPLSRDVEEQEWIDTMTTAMEQRFGSYEGGKLYHLGVSVDGYVVAQAGIPLVVAPKSILILNVTLWDDAKGAKVNEEPERVMVFESLNEKTLVGSGLTQSKQEQMDNLAYNAAKRIQLWLSKNLEDFGMNAPVEPAPEEAEAAAETEAADAAEAAETPAETTEAPAEADETAEAEAAQVWPAFMEPTVLPAQDPANP